MSDCPTDDPPWRGGLPPGPNVGTQLAALKRAKARRESTPARRTSAPAHAKDRVGDRWPQYGLPVQVVGRIAGRMGG